MMRYVRSNLLVLVLLLSLAALTVQADTPSVMNYQGYLTDALDDPINGQVDLVFAIYDDPEAAVTPLWEETHPDVDVVDGKVIVLLGQGTPAVPLTADIFGGPDRWLGVTVGTDSELLPRSLLITVPYAFRAATVDGATGGNIDGEVRITSGVSATELRLGFGDSALTVFNGSDDPIVVIYERSDGGGAVSVASTGSTKGADATGNRVELGPDGLIVFGATEADTNVIITTDGNITGIGQVTMGANSSSAGTASTLLGLDNIVDGDYSAIGGGTENVVFGNYATIPGGYGDTIGPVGHYSYLFGITSRLDADSTFMIDMPHIRFGDEVTGYEFPTADGTVGQSLVTNGAGQLGWGSPGGGGGGWSTAGNYVRLETTTDSVGIGLASPTEKLDVAGNIHASGMITSGNSISINGITNVISSTSGSISFDNDNLVTTGKTTFGAGNTNPGLNAFVSGANNDVSGDSATVSGGSGSTADGLFAAIGGGRQNSADFTAATVGGGWQNMAGGYAVVAGGLLNQATGSSSAIGGGESNSATSQRSVVSGGLLNDASGEYSVVGGGGNNIAGGEGATVGGGGLNGAHGNYSVVAGGGGTIWIDSNLATAARSTVSGGRANEATNLYATVGGGNFNHASGEMATIGGGNSNIASDTASTVGGGRHNYARGHYSVIAGGGGRISSDSNSVSGKASAIGGGTRNVITDSYATIGGGYINLATQMWTTIGGGGQNTVDGTNGTVGGGYENTAGYLATVAGGYYNAATVNSATVGGGKFDSALAVNSTIGGGSYNLTDSGSSTIAGGNYNTASGDFASIGGGFTNTAKGSYGAIAGGASNRTANTYAAIGGGHQNLASGLAATVAGGQYDSATASYSMVLGGRYCRAAGPYSLAAGRAAKADNSGMFVWADFQSNDFPSAGEGNFTPGPSQFLVRSTGGVVFVTAIDGVTGNSTSGVQLASGSGSWSQFSDRNFKENVEAVDGNEVLEKLADMPVATWNYKAQDDSIRHIGPMAQDMYAAFGVGEDNRHIATVDADGIALAAIKALYEKSKEVDLLRDEVAELKKLVKQLAKNK